MASFLYRLFFETPISMRVSMISTSLMSCHNIPPNKNPKIYKGLLYPAGILLEQHLGDMSRVTRVNSHMTSVWPPEKREGLMEVVLPMAPFKRKDSLATFGVVTMAGKSLNYTKGGSNRKNTFSGYGYVCLPVAFREPWSIPEMAINGS